MDESVAGVMAEYLSMVERHRFEREVLRGKAEAIQADQEEGSDGDKSLFEMISILSEEV